MPQSKPAFREGLTGKIAQALDSLTQAKRTAMQAQRDHRDLRLTGGERRRMVWPTDKVEIGIFG